MSSKNSKLKILTNGFLNENPVLRLVLGTCPTLATSTMASNGIGMGLAATFVLLCSNVVISALRKVIPDQVRIPCYITVIAGFVSVVQMLVKAFVPALDASLGVYLPLIVVNCIILGRAEMFASKNGIVDSALDGIGMGIGFTITLTIMGTIREILGSGTCDKTSKRYEFDGIHSCQAVKGLYGGDGLCKFGCLGYGDCTRACAFDAIHIVDGIAKVDREKCTGCGACAAVCPNSVISIIPEHKRKPVVLCQNKDKGALTRKACTAGCIGCMKCAKACPKEAITVENNVAYIDQSKCVGCQLCVKECPVGVIHVPADM